MTAVACIALLAAVWSFLLKQPVWERDLDWWLKVLTTLYISISLVCILAVFSLVPHVPASVAEPDLEATKMESVGSDRLEPLELRCRRLERANRVLMAWVLLLTLGLAFLAAASFPRRSQSHVVTDRSGRTRLSVDLDKDATEAVNECFWDESGGRQITLGLDAGSSPGVTFGELGELSMGVVRGFGPYLDLSDQRARRLISMGLDSEGRPSLTLLSPGTKSGVFVEFDKDGNPGLRLLDTKGKTLFQVPRP
jgi:hypothetical protein